MTESISHEVAITPGDSRLWVPLSFAAGYPDSYTPSSLRLCLSAEHPEVRRLSFALRNPWTKLLWLNRGSTAQHITNACFTDVAHHEFPDSDAAAPFSGK